MSALQLAWHRSWRTLAWYGVFTGWGIASLFVSIAFSMHDEFSDHITKGDAAMLAGLGVAAALGHLAGNVLALLRLRLWVVAVVGAVLAFSVATSMTALGDAGAFFAVFALAVGGGWLGIASRMEVLGALLPLTYAVGASVLWMNTHERVSVWLTGSKYAVWDPVTFAFLAGAVLLFVVFLSSRHALALTLWRDAARPGLVSVDDELARAGKGSTGALLSVAALLVMATAVLSPFLFRTQSDPMEQIEAASVTTSSPSYATHFSAGAPAPIHVGGGTVYLDDTPPGSALALIGAAQATAGAPIATGPGSPFAGPSPNASPNAPPSTPPTPSHDPDPPTTPPEAANCTHLSGSALFTCLTQLKTKHAPKPKHAAPSTTPAANDPTPHPLYTRPARVVVDPTHYVHTHKKGVPVAIGGVHAGPHGAAHVAPLVDEPAPVVDAPPAPVAWKDGATATVPAPASPEPSAGTPIPDGGDTTALAASSASGDPDMDRTLDDGKRAARRGLSLVALAIALLALGVAAAASFRPIRRAIVLRHLERPLWAETPTRRVENLWLRALVALDDFGIRETPGDTPEKLAFRATGVLAQSLGEVPRGIDAAARIMERVEYAGRGLSRDEETKMRKAVTDFLAYASKHLGLGKKIALAWSPIRTR